MALDPLPEFLRGSWPSFFCHFQRRIYKIFFYIPIVQCPYSLMPCLLTAQNFVNNFWKGTPKEHFYEIISKPDQWFQKRRFSKLPLELSCEIISKLDQRFRGEDF